MCGSHCFGHGTCFQGKCHCHPGYYGAYCHLSYYAKLCNNPCDSYSCSGNGYCRVNSAGRNPFCVCYKGWTGINCSKAVDHCTLRGQPCFHGYCVDNSTYCACDHGYEGKQCSNAKINHCRPNGFCTNIGESCDYFYKNTTYSCQCFDNCSKLVQEKSSHCPCKHGGICVPLYDEQVCKCPAEFTGQNCEYSIETHLYPE